MELSNPDTGTVPIEQYQALKNDYEKFAYIVSHDLKAPIRHVREFSRLLVQSVEQGEISEQAELASVIIQSSDKLNLLMEELLFFSRLSTGGLGFNAVELAEVFSAVCADMESRLVLADAKVSVDELPNVFGSRKQLTYLFKELLENSVFNRLPGKQLAINVTAKDLGNSTEIAFEDNGNGIPADRIDLAFSMFRKPQ